jgi:hypothetical protein
MQRATIPAPAVDLNKCNASEIEREIKRLEAEGSRLLARAESLRIALKRSEMNEQELAMADAC